MADLYHETLVIAANELGPLPQSVTRLSALFADPNYELREVVKAVELDSSMAGRLIGLANSSAYAGNTVSSVRDAVVRLGAGVVRCVAVAASVRPKSDMELSVFNLTPESYWQHCVAVLSFAEELAAYKPRTFTDDFATAALLHDFGKLLLAETLSPTYLDLLNQQDECLPSIEREMRALGVNHAEVSAVVAQSWKLPDDLVRAVQHHHTPSMCDTPMCYGLSISNHLARRLESGEQENECVAATQALSMASIGLDGEELDIIFERGAERFDATIGVFQ